MRHSKNLITILLSVFGVSYAYAALQDPTRPMSYQGEVPQYVDHRKPTVNSILIASDRQLAIVNGQFVEVGDTVRGATVTAITEHAVSFKTKDEVFTVSLSPDVIKVDQP